MTLWELKKRPAQQKKKVFVFTFNKYLSTISSLQLAHTALPSRGADAIACSDDVSPSKTSTDAPWRDQSSGYNKNERGKKYAHERIRANQHVACSIGYTDLICLNCQQFKFLNKSFIPRFPFFRLNLAICVNILKSARRSVCGVKAPA